MHETSGVIRMASHGSTTELPRGSKSSWTDRLDAWGQRQVSLATAAGVVLLTLAVLMAGGIWMGYHLFWDPFDQRSRAQVELERWQAAVRKNPADVQAHYQVGWAYYQSGQTDKAEQAYSRVLELQPEHVGARYNLGLIARRRGDLERAASLFRWITEKYPRHELAQYALGQTYLDLGQYDEAARAFHAALAVNPTSADTHYQLGLCYQSQGDNNRAGQEFKTALRYNPKFEEAVKALSAR